MRDCRRESAELSTDPATFPAPSRPRTLDSWSRVGLTLDLRLRVDAAPPPAPCCGVGAASGVTGCSGCTGAACDSGACAEPASAPVPGASASAPSAAGGGSSPRALAGAIGATVSTGSPPATGLPGMRTSTYLAPDDSRSASTRAAAAHFAASCVAFPNSSSGPSLTRTTMPRLPLREMASSRGSRASGAAPAMRAAASAGPAASRPPLSRPSNSISGSAPFTGSPLRTEPSPATGIRLSPPVSRAAGRC